MLEWLFGTKPVRQRLTEIETTEQRLLAAFKGLEGEWEATYRSMHALRVSLNKKAREAEKAEDALGTTIEKPMLPTQEADAVLLRRAFGRR